MNRKASKKDWILFILIMVIFIIGMVVLMIYGMKNYWIWTAYIVIWSWLEMKIAKNIHLKWWVWGLILLGLTLLDLLIIHLIK